MTCPVRVIYIVGSGHSGSTLMDMLLGGHSRVLAGGELVDYHRLVTRDPDLPADTANCTCGRVLDECGYWTRVRARLVASHGTDLLDVDADDERDMLEANERLFSAMLEAAGKSVVCDSSKSLERLRRFVASPRFDVTVAHLVRDGRAVAFSYKVKGEVQHIRRPGYEYHQALDNWCAANFGIAAELAREPGYRLVRYEDLVADPRAAIARVLDAVGLAPEEAQFDLEGPERHNISGNALRLRRGVGIRRDTRYLEQLSDADWRSGTGRARATLRLFGYPADRVETVEPVDLERVRAAKPAPRRTPSAAGPGLVQRAALAGWRLVRPVVTALGVRPKLREAYLGRLKRRRQRRKRAEKEREARRLDAGFEAFRRTLDRAAASKRISAMVITVDPNPLFDESLASVRNQTVPPAAVHVVRNEFPASKARQVGLEQVETEFFVVVDADMILSPTCFERLFYVIESVSNCAQAGALLDDPLVGEIFGVFIYRTAPVAAIRFHPVEGEKEMDRYVARRLRETGRQVVHARVVEGRHHPTYLPHEAFWKFRNAAEKARYYGDVSPNFRETLTMLADHWRRTGDDIAIYALAGLFDGLQTEEITEGLTYEGRTEHPAFLRAKEFLEKAQREGG